MDAQKTHFADDETLKHIDRLQALNAELVAALEGFINEFGDKATNANVQKARTALSKAKES